MALGPTALLSMTAAAFQTQLASGAVTSVQLVEACLAQIGPHEGYLHAVISVSPRETLLDAARRLDSERARGLSRGGLHGIPVVVKDNIATHADLGMDTTAGSMALAGSRPRAHAEVVQRLVDAGAIIVAKTNLSEFAWYKSPTAPSGWSPAGGQTQSPYVRSGVQKGDAVSGDSNPGGSSSGSAVAVAAGYAPVAIGTETNGSLIMPASRAALYALKPTVGIVPLAGVVPISKWFDSPGPMTKSAADLAVLLDAIIDSNRTRAPKGGYVSALTGTFDGLKIGTLSPEKWLARPEYRQPNAVQQMEEDILRAYDRLEEVSSTYRGNVKLISSENFDMDGKSAISRFLEATFRDELNEYLDGLEYTSVKSLAEIVQYNNDHSDVELPPDNPGQEFLESALRNNTPKAEIQGYINHCREVGKVFGLDKTFADNDINILIGPADSDLSTFAAAAGYPIAALPLSYLNTNGRPFGLAAVAYAHNDALLVQLLSAWEAHFPERQPPPALVGSG